MLLEDYKHLKGKEESNAINELKKIQKQPVPSAIQAFLKIYENGTDISYNNFITGITAIFGVLMGTYFSSNFGWFNEYIIPFAAGNFIYIAAANLVPELHRKCSLKESILDVVGLILGIALIIIITIYGPSHGH